MSDEIKALARMLGIIGEHGPLPLGMEGQRFKGPDAVPQAAAAMDATRSMRMREVEHREAEDREAITAYLCMYHGQTAEHWQATITQQPDKVVKILRADFRARTDPAGAAKLTGESKAVALLLQNPSWTDTRIAKAVGCSRTTLYGWPNYTKAREALKSSKRDLPTGTKRGDSGDLEAFDD